MIPRKSTEHLDQISYSGYCSDCEAVHTLPYERAVVHCNELMEQLSLKQRLDFEFPLKQSNADLSTTFLYSDMGGKMFGILVCEDEFGNEVILKAFSGKYNNRRTVQGWVPHLFDEAAFNAVIEEGNRGIHPLTEQIRNIEKDSIPWKAAMKARRQISLKILEELYALYQVHNFNNEIRTLSETFLNNKSIPTGTGDCCAPKLLNYAAVHQLKPISIAEFFIGKESASGERKEGRFYSPCTDKCQPLLGFMLCGINSGNRSEIDTTTIT